MVIFGVLSSNSFDITAMQMYIDPASIVITFGGSICSTIGCFKLADGINGFKSISHPCDGFPDTPYPFPEFHEPAPDRCHLLQA